VFGRLRSVGARVLCSGVRVGTLVALAVVLVGVGSSSASVAGSGLNLTGMWKGVYHCKTGWCAGKDFPAGPERWVQAPGSSKVTSPGWTATLIGRTLKIHVVGSYSFDATLTFSADGNSWSGPLSDSNKTSGIDTGVRVGAKKATLSVAVSASVKGGTASVGALVPVTVTVTAGAADLTNVNLGKGLVPSSDAAVVTASPSGLNGFSLAADASRAFTFSVKAEKEGKVSLKSTVSAETASSQALHGSGQTTLDLKALGYGFSMNGLSRPTKNGPLPSPLSPSKLAVGDTVTYALTKWNPDGGPVAISWGNRKLGHLAVKADGSSVGEFKIEEWDWLVRGTLSAPKQCQGDLVAKQGAIQRTLELQSPVQGAIVYNEHTSYPLKKGDLYCDGETPPRIAGGTLVYASPAAREEGTHQDFLPDYQRANGSRGFPLIIDNVERDTHVDFVETYFRRLVCVRLSGPRWLRVTVPVPGTIESSVSSSECPPGSPPGLNPILNGLDNKDEVGVRVLNAPTQPGMTINTNYYAGQDLEFRGELIGAASGAFLYVKGNLLLDSGLDTHPTQHGSLSLIATGDLVIKGSAHDVYAERGKNNDGYVHPGQVIWANGNTILWGQDQPPGG
jgi:hypothetical protein